MLYRIYTNINEIACYFKAVINLQIERQDPSQVLERIARGISQFRLSMRLDAKIEDFYYSEGLDRWHEIYPGLKLKRV